MNTQQHIEARAAQYPDHGAEYHAYYAGRNDGWEGANYANEITDAVLKAEYQRGYRSARAEARLDADTEWDAD